MPPVNPENSEDGEDTQNKDRHDRVADTHSKYAENLAAAEHLFHHRDIGQPEIYNCSKPPEFYSFKSKNPCIAQDERLCKDLALLCSFY